MPWDSTWLWVAELDHAPDGGPRRRTPRWWPAVRTSRSASPSGITTGGCGSSRTAPTGGTSTTSSNRAARSGDADRGGRAARRGRSSRCGCSAGPATRSSPTAGWCSRRRPTARDSSAVADPATGRVDRLSSRPRPDPTVVAAAPPRRSYVGASFTSEPAVHAALVGRNGAAGGAQLLRPARDLAISSAHLSAGQTISFPTGGRRRPRGPRASSTRRPTPITPRPQGERPPLVVMIHGGPTSAAQPELRLGVQFWTSRGLRGGRRRLPGQHRLRPPVPQRAAGPVGRRRRRGLRGRGSVPGRAAAASIRDRLLIRGGSAGGFTALAALTFTDAFAAGASYYGVADLALLAAETHKFEAALPRRAGRPVARGRPPCTRQRSPLAHVDQLDRPVIVFQGLDDKVVPPNQAQRHRRRAGAARASRTRT